MFSLRNKKNYPSVIIKYPLLSKALHSLGCFTEDIDTTKSAVDETAHQELLQEVHKLQTEYEDLQQRHESQIRDNTQLSR